MRNRLLVSCCNLGTIQSRYSLAVYDIEAQSVCWVNLDGSLQPDVDIGITGLCGNGTFWYAALQSDNSRILELDTTLSVRRVLLAGPSWDLHSLYLDGRTLYAAATRGNRVLRFDLDDDEPTGQTVWSAGELNRDQLHLNSIAMVDGELFATMFGAKREGQIRLGEVRNLTRDETVCDGLREPHSLLADTNGGFHFLESVTSTAFRLSGNRIFRRYRLSGYLRGLVIGDQVIHVGRSCWRTTSRSLGCENPPPIAFDAHGNDWQRSGIYTFSHDGGAGKFFDFTPYAGEIYDLAVVPSEVIPKRVFADAAGRRIDAVYEELARTRAWALDLKMRLDAN